VVGRRCYRFRHRRGLELCTIEQTDMAGLRIRRRAFSIKFGTGLVQRTRLRQTLEPA
jgi:hypothetical protein